MCVCVFFLFCGFCFGIFFGCFQLFLRSRGCQNSSGRPGRMSSDQVPSKLDHRKPKNEQKTDRNNEYLINEYKVVSVQSISVIDGHCFTRGTPPSMNRLQGTHEHLSLHRGVWHVAWQIVLRQVTLRQGNSILAPQDKCMWGQLHARTIARECPIFRPTWNSIWKTCFFILLAKYNFLFEILTKLFQNDPPIVSK